MNPAKSRTLFLNLTQDLMFKNYFKLNKKVLKSLLKAFLPLPKNYSIKDIIILDSLIPSLSPEEKSSLLDLRLQLNTGEFVNVEMQAFPHKSFMKRILLYWAKSYSSQIRTGEKYEKLCPAYSLIFSTFPLFPKTEYFYTPFSIRSDVPPYFRFDEGLRIITVELSKFKKKEPAALLDLREEWCYLLKESKVMGEKEGNELSMKGQEMEEAMFHLKELSRDEGLRLVEEAREKAWKDQAAREDDSFNRGIEQGIEKGIEKGMEKGIEKGMEKGMEKGIEKGKKELVMNMLKQGLDVPFISKVTGLSKEKIKKLS